MKYYRITELATTTGASRDELHYMERKGFITSTRQRLKKRDVRQYSDKEANMATLIIKFRRQGFTWDIAFQKAMQDSANPPLFEIE